MIPIEPFANNTSMKEGDSMRGIARLLITVTALCAAVGVLEAQDFRITTFAASGRMTWTNAPAEAVCRVEGAHSLTSVWNSVFLTETGTVATVDLPSQNCMFYRVYASPITNIAYYPLTTDANDVTGNYGPMTLLRAPFTNGGIYCNGLYEYDWPSRATVAHTPQLTSLDFSGFMISADFLVTNTTTCPVFIGGHGWRWGGFYVISDGTVALECNNGRHLGTLRYSTNVWHHAVLIYTEANQTFEIYLDGTFAVSQQVPINYSDNDRDVSVTDYSGGKTFLGYLRNLKIFNLK